ncbi:uncharacterized protein LOC141641383 [Silene latifolia]|uniref:uncharacterized protein LOC141641383 n=1 Tax=Silene latifolia TaxID=37657 RepID=UPI003D7796A7
MERIQALCRNFLWEGGESYSKAPLVSWNILCKGKNFGGLGLIDNKLWNLAVIGKLAWWILMKKDLLWIRWIDSIYLKGSPCLSYSSSPNSSCAWHKVCEVKDKFKLAYDSGMWQGDTEAYNIAKGYDWLGRNDDQKVQWEAMVWNRYNIPKHNFINWMIQRGRFLTLDRLAKMGICDNGLCFLCGQCPETHQHIFEACPYIIKCFSLLHNWLGIVNNDLNYGVLILKDRLQSLLIRMLKSVAVMGLYYQVKWSIGYWNGVKRKDCTSVM